MNNEYQAKKQNQIKDLFRLDGELMENIFNVYQEPNGLYYYNLLQTIVFPQNLPPSFFDSYTTQHNDTWPLISFKVYRTPNLWWLLLLANNLQNPTKKINVGTKLLIPTPNTVKIILNQINQNK